MISDKDDIERVLSEGKRILSEHPELAEMSLNDVLDELDDGTQQMIHDRWGVTAWLVVKPITNFDITDLVIHLSQIESGVLTYEYAGYLLQAEFAVNLESLILEAERCGQFEKIALFVRTNLIFETKFHTQYVQQILVMLENNLTTSSYHPLLKNYADHIAEQGTQRMVEEILGDLSGQAQYDLMRILRWSWYSKDPTEASEVIGRMMDRGSIWSKKVAVDFLEVSLNHDKAEFRKHFSEMENMLAKSEELWLMIIPVFSKFVMVGNAEETLNDLYHQVLEYLKTIPSDSINAKCSFLESIHWKEEIPENLLSIFRAVISQPCGKDPRLLDLLDHILYAHSKKEDWKAALQAMLVAFKANEYRTNYNEFFKAMHLVNDLISKHADEVTIEALQYILSSDVDRVFFGLGLFMNVGKLEYIQNKENFTDICFSGGLTEKQMIKLMKVFLYYAFDNKKICYMAFQLLKVSQEFSEKYSDFCMIEVYGNYPTTMHEVAVQNRTSSITAQADLAETVIKAYKRSSEDRMQSYKIKDLQPSRENQYIYHRARVEQNRRINKSANDQSVLMNLCTRRNMKYGVRHAFIVTGRKDQKSYQVSPYQHFGYEVELPVSYVNDPVGYEIQRRAYLSEVIQDATDN